MKVKIIWRGAKCDKLHEIIWEIEFFIVYARKEDRDSAHNASGGMEIL
jgi:hypothetical protein